jgi:tRNA1Val (adenine37-N6)-methyltransferase
VLSLFVLITGAGGKNMADFLKSHTDEDQIPIFADDTIEDLQRGGFRLIQKRKGFRFGLDSVLLAAFAAAFYPSAGRRVIRAADLGAGCGAVSILLAARMPSITLASLEIDPVSCETLQRNIRLNRLDQRLTAIQGDIRLLASGAWSDPGLAPGSFDLVVSNPPYEAAQPGRRPLPDDADEGRRRSREETELSLGDLVQAAARLLRPGGRLVLVHQVRRLPDILCILRENDLEAKTMRMVQSFPDKPPVIVLLSAVRNGRPGGFTAALPLIVNRSPGVLSEEAGDLYGLERQMQP